MDLVNAMKFIQDSSAPNLVEHAGDTFADRSLSRLPNYKYPSELQVSTLASLTGYILSGCDFVLEDELQYLIAVDSPTQVRLMSQLDDDEHRRHLMIARATLPSLLFDAYQSREHFQIALQSRFEEDALDVNDRELLLKFISHVQSGTIAEYGDDGISQKATISKGAQGMKSDVIIPNPVHLAPYRTFVDVKQPESEFIFRMLDDDHGGIQCGLWEADGGYWRILAIDRIKQYLIDALGDHLDKFVIIG